MTVESEPAAERVALGSSAARLGCVLATGGLLGAIGAKNGGYFPTSWGWGIALFGWCAVVLAIVRPTIRLPIPAVVTVALFAGLLVWTGLSSTWSQTPSSSILESERTALYVAVLVVLLLFERRLQPSVLLGGILSAIVALSVYALATRVFPERARAYDAVSGVRLSIPLGYWNGLGLLCALGALVSIGFVLHAHRVVLRAAAAAALTVLMPTMYFTVSRGSWAALAVGTVALLAFEHDKVFVGLAFAVSILPAAAAVFIASRASSLTTFGAPVAARARDGHRMGLGVLVLAIAALLLVWAWSRFEPRIAVSESARRLFAVAVTCAAVAAVAAAVVQWGSPWHMAQRGWHSFVAAPPAAVSGTNVHWGTNVSGRLLQLSNNNRIASWRSALHQWERDPLLGQGAGSFETWWQQHRSSAAFQLRDAHSLFLETLGELGMVGFLLLVVALAVPLAAAAKARSNPLVPCAAGGYIAWIVHAAVDWDWELPAVTLVALAFAMTCCAAAPTRSLRLTGRFRVAMAASMAAIAAFGIAAAIGNQADSASHQALEGKNYALAQADAEKASRWAPWASDPWVIEGQIAALGLDRLAARRDFERAVSKDPSNYLAWFGLAGVTEGQARKVAVRKVETLNPLSDEAKEVRLGS